MRLSETAIAIVLLAFSTPTFADTNSAAGAGAQAASSSGGVIDWVLSAFDTTPAATQSRETEAPTAKGTAEPKPDDLSSGVDSDKDSYKPDAGDAPK